MHSWFKYFKNALKRELPEDPVSGKSTKGKTSENLKILFPFIRKFWKRGVLGGILIIIIASLSFPAPLINRYLIDKVILAKEMKYLLITVLALTLLKLFQRLFTTYQKFYFNKFEQDVTLDIQHTLIDRILHYPKSFFDTKDTGYLMTRIFSDVAGLRWFFSSTIVYLISSAFRFTGGAFLLFYLKWELALVVLMVIPGMVFIARYFAGKSKVLSHRGMEQSARVNRDIQESLSTSSLIKAFSTEKSTADQIAGQMRRSVDLRLESSTISSAAGILVSFFPEIARFIVLFAGGYWIINGEWSLGSLLAFQSYIGYVYGPAQFLATANLDFQNSMASLERVSALMDIVPEDNLEGGKKVEHLKGSIEFRDVIFSYGGGEKVFEDISFNIEPGEWVGIAGPSGVGKTSLISLIMNFYKPDSGEIFFDGIPTSELNLKYLRDRIGYVSQNPTILSSTVKKNLKYGNEDASDEDVKKAVRISGIDEFINSLPGKYNEKLGEKGVNLSEGQRQRLSLARALVRDPDILILDEPTSSLDRKIEHEIFDSLPKVLKNKTLILISHRPSTLKVTSKVIFLSDNRIAGVAKYNKLLSDSAEFRNLMES